MALRSYPITEIATVVQATSQVIGHPDRQIRTLSYDSRKLRDVAYALFFALRGRRDGHEFLEEAYAQGVRNFVVSDMGYVRSTLYPDANFLIVADTLHALQELASHHRSRFHYPVVAITGSNGKTVVKDWLYQLLSPEFSIVRSPKSFNSQLGVALSLWEMDDGHQLALIEAGISRRGEMGRLQEVIRPDIAILTNVGAAHQEGFDSLEEKRQEKFVLLQQASKRVYPRDTADRLLAQGLLKIAPDDWDWSRNADARIVIAEQLTQEGKPGHRYTTLRAHIKGQADPAEITIPFSDAASVENAITCWATMLMLGYSQKTIAERMKNLQMMEMRLQLREGANQCSIIDDSYSNDLSSLSIALDFLKQQQQHPIRTLILSDLPELGNQEDQAYSQVHTLLSSNPPDRLITVGPFLQAYAEALPIKPYRSFPDTATLLETLPELNLRGQTILLKGARKFGFEEVSARLVAKTHETVMEINMNALEHNLRQYKSMLDEGVRLMVMVKAFSYGSGTFEIAGMLQFIGVDYLAVAFADEGIALRKAGITLPILVMSPDRGSFASMYEHRLEPELFSFSVLEDWIAGLQERGERDYPVHIKLDTGMHRLGYSSHELDALSRRLAAQEQVRVKSVFSHLAASGDPAHDEFTHRQHTDFLQMSTLLKENLGYDFLRHLANTDAVSRFPEAQLDMVRLGIGMYGFSSAKTPALESAIQVKTTVTQLRRLHAGETVGYNRRGTLTRDSLIATVKIGYADGYDRRFGNGVGRMRIRDQEVPTVGDICMDMCMLDVTDVDEVSEGDQVVVYGDVDRMAKAIGTIPYELLVNVSHRVKRVYYYG